MEDNLTLAELIDYFEESEEATELARVRSERDRDYYNGEQLTEHERAELARRGQPDIVINRIRAKVNFLKGYEVSQRQDPRGFPRTPQDEDAAEACTDALRYVADVTDLDTLFSAVWENMLIEGFGGLELNIEEGEDGQPAIIAKLWNWDRLFYDPHSREYDFSDARYVGGVVWMDVDEAKRIFPGREAADAIEATARASHSGTYDDRPLWRQWSGRANRPRVRIAQMWYRRGADWHWCIFTHGGKLASGPVPFADSRGRSFCNLLMVSAYVDRNNNRHGFVRDLISPQDEINKRRSKALHMSMGTPLLYEEGAFQDENEARRQLNRPDGMVAKAPGLMVEFMEKHADLAVQLQLQQEAKNEIDLMGPNAAMSGKGERAASGRAIIANQQGGEIEITAITDRYRSFRLRVYRRIWDMIRMFWTEERWVRVTDNDKNIRFVGLNKPVTMAEDLISQAVAQGVPEDQARQTIEQRMQNPQYAAQLQQVVRMENVPSEMGMDIILDETPSTANIQQEQFEVIAGLVQAGVQIPPKVIIMASALRNKAELLKEMEASEEAAAADPARQAAMQAEMAAAEAEIDKTRALTGKARAEAIRTLVETDLLDNGMVDQSVAMQQAQPAPQQPQPIQ